MGQSERFYANTSNQKLALWTNRSQFPTISDVSVYRIYNEWMKKRIWIDRTADKELNRFSMHVWLIKVYNNGDSRQNRSKFTKWPMNNINRKCCRRSAISISWSIIFSYMMSFLRKKGINYMMNHISYAVFSVIHSSLACICILLVLIFC